MRTLIKNGYVYGNRYKNFRPLDILCRGEKIVKLAPWGDIREDADKVIDAAGCALFPGLIDVHTHGRDGYDFNSADGEAMAVMARGYAACGVTAVMPTLASAPLDEMMASVERISSLAPTDGGAVFFGVHLEGRYLAPEKRGAHALSLLAPLAAEELENDALRKAEVLHISAAYELDCDGSFADKAKALGATLGLGHTCATFAQARMAESRGVTAYTHLFNAMPPLHHRDGGAVASCLMGDAYAELICDGIHIAPEMVNLAYSLKKDRLVLISDSMEATGAADGEYSIAGNPVTVKNGKALTHDGALAGSTLTLDKAVQNLMDFCHIPLSRAIICATQAPAKEMGIFDTCGSIAVGKRADIIFADMDEQRFNIRQVMLRGISI